MPYDLRNSSVFSARLNASSDGSDVITGGSVFQTFAAATGKARSPMVLCNDRGTCSDGDDADRRRLCDSMSVTRCSSLQCWDGKSRGSKPTDIEYKNTCACMM